MPYADKQKQKEAVANWAKNHRDRTNAFTRKWYNENKETYRRPRNAFLIRTYGITKEQYDHMVTAQDNKCAICGEIFVKTPHVDHDHSTGKVRQLLCGNCNCGLGWFRENISALTKAIEYLNKWKV